MLVLLGRRAIVRRRRLLPLRETWFRLVGLVGIANSFSHRRVYHIIHLLLLLLLPVISIIILVLLLLHLLLLPLPLIYETNIECRVNQLVFVCYASTSMRMIPLTELVLWRRSRTASRRALRTSEMGYRGLGAGAARINALCAGTVVQWFAREAPRGNIRAHEI